MRRNIRHHPTAVALMLVLSCVVALLAGGGALMAAGSFATHAPLATGSRDTRTGAIASGGVAGILAGDAETRSAGCGSAPLLQPGTTATFNLPSGDLSRSFLVHLPPTYTARVPEPLVLSFHGTGGTAASQERTTGFSRLADQQRFIVVYPQGTLGSNHKTGWASGGLGHPTINDVSFVANLLTYVQSHLCVDTRRVYATGFSNGGGMTSLLACRLSQRIAAFAIVSGSYYDYLDGCIPGRSVPLLEIHGTSDHIVPYAGRGATHLVPVMAWLDAWAARDSCAHTPQVQAVSNTVVRLAWTACRGNVGIVHYRILGGVHAWPAAVGCGQQFVPDVPCPGDRTFPASATIWRFLSQYRLPVSSSQQPALAAEHKPSPASTPPPLALAASWSGTHTNFG